MGALAATWVPQPPAFVPHSGNPASHPHLKQLLSDGDDRGISFSIHSFYLQFTLTKSEALQATDRSPQAESRLAFPTGSHGAFSSASGLKTSHFDGKQSVPHWGWPPLRDCPCHPSSVSTLLRVFTVGPWGSDGLFPVSIFFAGRSWTPPPLEGGAIE